ncbi:MAG TPA: hypothetical protein VLG28_17390 [Acidimicrobiia bacterium]|jgi:hypothetical protein|nr:hypothetical protein [Acidimicrobiia bacterium]
MAVRSPLPGVVEGTCGLRRVGRWRFPVEELFAGDRTLAKLGRDGSMRIFFGPGRRVVLDSGVEWRIKAATSARHIVPILRSEQGTVVVTGPLHAKRSYGINGKDFAFFLIPMGHTGVRRAGEWALRRHETEVAMINDRRRTMTTSEPIPVAAVLMAFTLITHGIPGEANMTPPRD